MPLIPPNPDPATLRVISDKIEELGWPNEAQWLRLQSYLLEIRVQFANHTEETFRKQMLAEFIPPKDLFFTPRQAEPTREINPFSEAIGHIPRRTYVNQMLREFEPPKDLFFTIPVTESTRKINPFSEVIRHFAVDFNAILGRDPGDEPMGVFREFAVFIVESAQDLFGLDSDHTIAVTPDGTDYLMTISRTDPFPPGTTPGFGITHTTKITLQANKLRGVSQNILGYLRGAVTIGLNRLPPPPRSTPFIPPPRRPENQP